MGRTSDARQRLMDAVLELIWKGSYGQTTIDLICETAGVKKGSFYHFFESKSDLTATALDDSWEQTFRPIFDAMFSPSKSPVQRLIDYTAHGYAEQVQKHKECGYVLGCPLFSLGNEISTQEERLRGVVQKLLNMHVRYIESALRDGAALKLFTCPNPALMAKTIFRYLEGALTEARIMNDPALLKGMDAAIFNLLGINLPATSAKARR